MPRVLVSGAAAQVDQVAAALERRGAQVTRVTDLAEVPAVCRAAGAAAFHGYVQLPATFEMRGETAVERLRRFYAEGVLARYSALDAALPALAPDARVTCVLGILPPEAETADDIAARRALVRVLARAARADTPDGRLSVAILDAGTAADDVAFAALGGDLAKQELLNRLEQVDYQEWRVELFGLVSVEM
jgi:hypothetical protein